MAGLAYFRHLGLVFLILQSATLYSRQQNRPARQLRYLTSSAILPDGEEDVRLFEIRNTSTSSAEHLGCSDGYTAGHSHSEQASEQINMSGVWSCNEWDQLEEVIVGNPLNARYPTPDRSTQLAEFPDRSLAEIPRGPFPQQIIEETEEDLNGFAKILEGLGIAVKRPDTWPHEGKFSTIHWEVQGYYNYCPRDVLLVIGDHIIETPNVIRSRAQETFSYRALLMEYMRSGAKWYSAPKPMLLDSLFEGVDLNNATPRNDEPAFDAANVLRFGK